MLIFPLSLQIVFYKGMEKVGLMEKMVSIFPISNRKSFTFYYFKIIAKKTILIIN